MFSFASPWMVASLDLLFDKQDFFAATTVPTVLDALIAGEFGLINAIKFPNLARWHARVGPFLDTLMQQEMDPLLCHAAAQHFTDFLLFHFASDLCPSPIQPLADAKEVKVLTKAQTLPKAFAPICEKEEAHSPAPIRGKEEAHSPAPIRGEEEAHSPAPSRGNEEAHASAPNRGKEEAHASAPSRGNEEANSRAAAKFARTSSLSGPGIDDHDSALDLAVLAEGTALKWRVGKKPLMKERSWLSQFDRAGVFASCVIRAGSVIAVEAPFVCVLSDRANDNLFATLAVCLGKAAADEERLLSENLSHARAPDSSSSSSSSSFAQAESIENKAEAPFIPATPLPLLISRWAEKYMFGFDFQFDDVLLDNWALAQAILAAARKPQNLPKSPKPAQPTSLVAPPATGDKSSDAGDESYDSVAKDVSNDDSPKLGAGGRRGDKALKMTQGLADWFAKAAREIATHGICRPETADEVQHSATAASHGFSTRTCAGLFRFALELGRYFMTSCSSSLLGLQFFKCFSLVSHSCQPNASFWYTPKGEVVVVASSDIAENEELTVSLDPGLGLFATPTLPCLSMLPVVQISPAGVSCRCTSCRERQQFDKKGSSPAAVPAARHESAWSVRRPPLVSSPQPFRITMTDPLFCGSVFVGDPTAAFYRLQLLADATSSDFLATSDQKWKRVWFVVREWVDTPLSGLQGLLREEKDFSFTEPGPMPRLPELLSTASYWRAVRSSPVAYYYSALLASLMPAQIIEIEESHTLALKKLAEQYAPFKTPSDDSIKFGSSEASGSSGASGLIGADKFCLEPPGPETRKMLLRAIRLQTQLHTKLFFEFQGAVTALTYLMRWFSGALTMQPPNQKTDVVSPTPESKDVADPPTVPACSKHPASGSKDSAPHPCSKSPPFACSKDTLPVGEALHDEISKLLEPDDDIERFIRPPQVDDRFKWVEDFPWLENFCFASQRRVVVSLASCIGVFIVGHMDASRANHYWRACLGSDVFVDRLLNLVKTFHNHRVPLALLLLGDSEVNLSAELLKARQLVYSAHVVHPF